MFEKNLKYYRLKNNMSKVELSKACGVTPMAISNYESGARKPDMPTIKKMADVLGVYVADFITPRNMNLKFQHGEFRKKSVLSKGQQEFVRESVEEYFSRFFDTVENIGGDPLVEPIQVEKLSVTGDYEEDAKSLRQHLELPAEGPILNLVKILENKGIMIVFVDIDNKGFDGMNGMVNNYPYIAVNNGMRKERLRTTIVHELAHLMFNWDNKNDINEEKHATAIAGAFLITRNDLIRELGVRKSSITEDLSLTCEEYGISMYLLVKRGAQTGIIPTAVEKDFYIRANAVDWKNKEPERVHWTEKSDLLKQLVCRAVSEENLSYSRGAELLKVPLVTLKQLVSTVLEA